MPQLPISDFTVQFSRHLRDYMRNKGITVDDVATRMGRSPTFVSEHTHGLRDPGTDLINAVARLAGTDPRSLVAEISLHMLAPPDVDADAVEAAPHLEATP
jgi:transcriptional regulator with XRE-family HTH domain